MPELKTPAPVLKPGVIYAADNGRLICVKCAGASAKFTGRDISGQKVAAMGRADDEAWFVHFKKHMTCEAGCTTFTSPEFHAFESHERYPLACVRCGKPSENWRHVEVKVNA